MINSSYLRLRGNEFRLANPPENIERPRRIRFSFPRRVVLNMLMQIQLRDGDYYQMTEADYIHLLIDRCYRLADLANAYQLDIWYDLRTQTLNYKFSLID